MRSIRRAEVPADPLPGRAVQRIVGRGASLASEEMTVGTARYGDEYGPMEPHHHAEETIVVLEADRAWVRWGPGRGRPARPPRSGRRGWSSTPPPGSGMSSSGNPGDMPRSSSSMVKWTTSDPKM